MSVKKEQALRAMMYEYIKSYNDEERDRIHFFPDYDNEKYCAWAFLQGRNKITWKYIYETEQIEKESIDYVKFMAK